MAHRDAARRRALRPSASAPRTPRRGERWWWILTLGLVTGLLLYLFRHF